MFSLDVRLTPWLGAPMAMNTQLGMVLRFLPARAAAATLAIVLLAAGDLQADDGSARQIWLISTRRVSRCDLNRETDPPLDYRRLAPDGAWQESDREAFLATDDPAVPTCIFIHGNRETYRSAICTGMTTYRQLVACVPKRDFRYVIWSWPAARVCRRTRDDLRLKASRSDVESCLLARSVDRIRADVPVSMIGYSFGARVITGALHVLGGGQVAGRSLPERPRWTTTGSCPSVETAWPWARPKACSSPETPATRCSATIPACMGAAARRPWDTPAPPAPAAWVTSAGSWSCWASAVRWAKTTPGGNTWLPAL